MAEAEATARRLYEIAARVEAGGDLAVRKAALAIDQAVVIGTPVDTGRARSNWLAGLDEVRGEEIEAHFPGKEGSTAAQNADQSISEASQVIAGYDGSQHSEIHITNNLPYIASLNAGTSAQAPAMFVEQAVAAGLQVVREVRILDGDGTD